MFVRWTISVMCMRSYVLMICESMRIQGTCRRDLKSIPVAQSEGVKNWKCTVYNWETGWSLNQDQNTYKIYKLAWGAIGLLVSSELSTKLTKEMKRPRVGRQGIASKRRASTSTQFAVDLRLLNGSIVTLQLTSAYPRLPRAFPCAIGRTNFLLTWAIDILQIPRCPQVVSRCLIHFQHVWGNHPFATISQPPS